VIDRMTYFECWKAVATALLAQALAGEPALTETEADPEPGAAGQGTFSFVAVLGGDLEGNFSIGLDGALLGAALMGEAADQRAGWQELLREVAEAAAGELLARAGTKCHVVEFRAFEGEFSGAVCFALKAGDRAWSIRVLDGTWKTVKETAQEAEKNAVKEAAKSGAGPAEGSATGSGVTPGVELLLDVELEAALRFGCREMPLGEILDLGPGDVVELDRHIADPVDLIVGDKIVARGEVVLVNGNFGLRVTEVAEPRRRLESIRCLF
jgi:flagellar motor switch protein FliN